MSEIYVNTSNNVQYTEAPSGDPSDDLKNLLADLNSMNLSGDQPYAIQQLKADIKRLQQDLHGQFSQDQLVYINQAISDTNNLIATYQQKGTVDMGTLLNAYAEFNTPLLSENCANDPTKLAAIKAAATIMDAAEMEEGITYGYTLNSSGQRVLTYFHPTQDQTKQLNGAMQPANALLMQLSASLPSYLQPLIQQLNSYVQSGGTPQQIAVEANKILTDLNYPPS